MKIISLAKDAIIEDVFCRAGQIVTVPDDFSGNIARVVVSPAEYAKREKEIGDKLKKDKEKKDKPEKPTQPEINKEKKVKP